MGVSLLVFHFSFAQTCQWARRARDIYHDVSKDIATDSHGNVYATGDGGNIQFGNTPSLIGDSVGNIFITKYNSLGVASWAKCATKSNSISNCGSRSICTDSKTNIYITGYFSDSIKFGNLPFIKGYSFFLSKYDSSGIALWAESCYTPNYGSSATGFGITSDFKDNIYVTGDFNYTVQFGTTPYLNSNLNNSGSVDIFIAKYNNFSNLYYATAYNIYPALCPGVTTTLRILGGILSNGAKFKWYSGSCGGTFVGTSNSNNLITVTPTANTTYFVRAEGPSNTTSCLTVNVTVGTPSTGANYLTITPSTVNYLSPTTLNIIGGSLGTSAIWVLYRGVLKIKYYDIQINICIFAV